MCNECVKEEYPDRGTTCMDNGSYLMNFAGCHDCGKLDVIAITNRHCTDEDDDDEEIITYQHICSTCGHVIANHEYTFRVEDEYQVYEMDCVLCGRADDSRSIMPCDPRGPKD